MSRSVGGGGGARYAPGSAPAFLGPRQRAQSSARRRIDAVVPAGSLAFFAALHAVVLGLYALMSTFGGGAVVVASVTLPLLTLGSCLRLVTVAIRRTPIAVWSPLTWLLCSYGVAYGFGPLANHLANDVTQDYMSTYYNADDMQILRTNMLNACGLAGIALGYLGGAWLAAPRLGSWRIPLRRRSETFWLILFVILGLPARYFVFLPHAFGWTSTTVPGVVLSLGVFAHLAVFVAAKLTFSGARRLAPLLLFLVLGNVATAVLTFSKAEVLTSVFMLGLGIYVARRKPRDLLFVGAACVVTYLFLLPLVSASRVAIGPQAGYADRLDAAVASSSTLGEGAGVQTWWSRLNNAPAQAFAMAEYDAGRPGATFAMAPYALIPRLLMPSKPLMAVGGDFTYLAIGSDTTSTSPTTLGEAYWNGGWLMLIFASLFIGFLLRMWEAVCWADLSAGNLGILPPAFMGVSLALQPEAWFVAGYIGTPGLAVVYLLAMIAASSLPPRS